MKWILKMKKWTYILKDITKKEKGLKTVIMSENNHYTGFEPDTAKMIGEMMDLKGKNIMFPIIGYKRPKDLEVKNYSKFEDLKYKKPRQSEMLDFL